MTSEVRHSVFCRLENQIRARPQQRTNRILILAGDSDGNIGDKAIVYAMCQELKQTIPGLAITILSSNPEQSRNYFRVATVSRGLKGLVPLLAAIRRSNLVLCGGGGLFQDDDSRIKMPYWGMRIALVRLLGRKVIGYSIGVGPLKHGLSRLFGRLAFACMDVVSVRDPEAMQLSRGLTTRPVILLPDPALSLKPASPARAAEILRAHNIPDDGRPLVGVAARQWFHHRDSFVPHKYAHRFKLGKTRGGDKCHRLILQLASVLDRLAEKRDVHIVFMPSYNVAHEGDDRVCSDIISKMRSSRVSLIPIAEPCLYKAVTRRLDVMLGGRMHPTIFAASMGVPVVGLAYNPKFKGFFQLIGCADKVIPIQDFVDRNLTEELYRLLEAPLIDKPGITVNQVPHLTARLHTFNAAIRERLSYEYPQ